MCVSALCHYESRRGEPRALPFRGGSRGHAEGLLQVELARGDAVGRLGQTDAAVPEEFEASR